MPIYRQTYCHYDGIYYPHSIAWMTIAKKIVELIWRNKWFKFFRFPVLGLFILFTVWIYFSTNSEIVNLLDIDIEGIQERLSVNFEFYYTFISTQMYICLFITLGVCPLLVSNDLKYKAIGLYLSKSLTRFDYLFGKGMGLFAYLAVILILMPLLLAFLYASFSDNLYYVLDASLLMKIVLFGSVIAVPLVVINLAISSLTHSSATVNVTQVIVYFLLPQLGRFIGNIVQSYSFFAEEDSFLYFVSYYEWWSLFAPTEIWLHLGQVLFEQDQTFENMHWGVYLAALFAICAVCVWYLHIRIKPVEIVK